MIGDVAKEAVLVCRGLGGTEGFPCNHSEVRDGLKRDAKVERNSSRMMKGPVKVNGGVTVRRACSRVPLGGKREEVTQGDILSPFPSTMIRPRILSWPLL